MATPVFDEQGNVAYAIVAFQDITERRQAERLLADYNRALEQQVAERTAALQKSEAALRGVYDELRLREQELKESNLLRMGQEALTNAIRHANADEICVELVYETTHYGLRVKANGRGFGVGTIPNGKFGLLGMSERAERIGAQLTIQSQPGQGTEIIVTVNRE